MNREPGRLVDYDDGVVVMENLDGRRGGRGARCTGIGAVQVGFRGWVCRCLKPGRFEGGSVSLPWAHDLEALDDVGALHQELAEPFDGHAQDENVARRFDCDP